MTGRPDALFKLFAALTSLPGIGPKMAAHFEGLRVSKPRDLIFTLPHSVIDRRPVPTIQGIETGRTVTVEITVQSHQLPRSKGRPHRVTVTDPQAAFELIFFHARGDYVERQLPVGARRLVSGKLDIFDGRAQITHPDFIVAPDAPVAMPDFEPVYPLAAGITAKVMQKAVRAAADLTPNLAEWIEPSVVADKNWPDFKTALTQAHAPQALTDTSPDALARQRLAYDELLAHQVTKAIARAQKRVGRGQVTQGTGLLQRRVLDALPYAPTAAQSRAVAEIQIDLAAPERMNRLLQGDVGSGKTIVALLVMVIAIEAGMQTAMMAPTEVLARQHMETLLPLTDKVGLKVELLTGREKGRTRKDILGRVESGDTDILLGTHALFQSDVIFDNLGLAIIDEQHRFGVHQRLALQAKGRGAGADMLVMTATPIPRTLLLTHYGDMDVSRLTEKPAGRKPVTTRALSSDRIEDIFIGIKRALSTNTQVYWVCPLVETSEKIDLAAAEERFAHLQQYFGDKVGLVHGQMKGAEKDAIMASFSTGELSILVSTTVIEVGVNVPNASIMVIEHAERFGLAQLHQLRGRVGR
ncbi:MAG: ATP-dependent DNA helicase RecG, partial [Pseudomonadota bacterium]